MTYDYIICSDGNAEYGIIRGSERIVFVKVGLGGDQFGYENKYLILAHKLHDKFGCSVIVASNPHDGKSHVERDRTVIKQFIIDNNITETELFFFGSSNGGIKGLELSYSGIFFTKMILVNMPLMINFHKTKQYISGARKTDFLLIYGERDPSFNYVPFIEGKYGNLKVEIVPKADHNFTGLLDKFIDYGERLFIK